MRSQPQSDIPADLASSVYWVLAEDMRTPVSVPIPEGMAWSNANGSVRVAFDEIGGISVSTVFIPRIAAAGSPPHPFETLVTSETESEEGIHRWKDWDEAAAGHAALVAGFDAPGASRRG